MQPFTSEFANEQLVAQQADISIGDCRYRAVTEGEKPVVVEVGPGGRSEYTIEHAMGGKNVYYFLTPLERGRLQVLPVAFDVRRKEWFDTAASMVRHAAALPDEPLHWKDSLLTFNTACYSCHVSQLSTNYDLNTDTYYTEWAEPGVNCETCHGPCAEHVRVCQEAPDGKAPDDLKIIRYGDLSVRQINDTCAPCHAKMRSLTTTFTPGERYFDHYGLATLEDRDFYPDGRDLGENYTYTTWRMSPCAKSGKLSCTHCHTSSGRYRFAKLELANNACLPCHEQHVADPTPHTHHEPGTPGSRCIDCHMPKTVFGRMQRSDHSMLPPTPAATIAFDSPNACNLCHTKPEEDAAWADQAVRQWHEDDYQAPVLHRASLIAAARKRDWTKLPDMLDYLNDKDHDEVFATSLIRLLAACPDDRKWPALRKALNDASPLARSAAAAVLEFDLTEKTVRALLEAAGDDYRLVRIRAAGALAAHPRERLSAKEQRRLQRASAEFEASLLARPDNWAAHYNLGNYYTSRGRLRQAVECFRVASRLRPDAVPPLVNASLVHARLGQTPTAEKLLRTALRIDPANAEANFNLALLLAEAGNLREAEMRLRTALRTAPDLDKAAYNLGVLLASNRIEEAIEWLRKAHGLRPDEPKYGYTLAFYLNQSGADDEACSILQAVIKRRPAYADAYGLLGMIYKRQKQVEEAAAVYRLAIGNLPPRLHDQFRARLRSLQPR